MVLFSSCFTASSASPGFRKLIKVFLPRAQEFQETYPLESAGFAYAQEDKVVTDTGLGRYTGKIPTRGSMGTTIKL